MAQGMVGNAAAWNVGMTLDKRRAAGNVAAVDPATNLASTSLSGRLVDVASMKTRLAAISGTTYTAAVLNAMTVNDMIYALRVADEAAAL